MEVQLSEARPFGFSAESGAVSRAGTSQIYPEECPVFVPLCNCNVQLQN